MKNVLLILLVLLLSSCEENFGRKIEKFVNNEVKGLSNDLSESALRKKSLEGSYLSLAELTLKIDNILNETKKIELNDNQITAINDYKTSLEAFNHYEKIEGELNLINIELENIINILKNASQLCEKLSRDINLEKIRNLEIINIAKLDENTSIEISNNIEETIIKNAINLLLNGWFNKQVKIANKAISQIPKRLISQKELEVMFNRVCLKEQSQINISQDYSSVRSLTQKARSILIEKIKITKKFKLAASKFLKNYNSEHIIAEYGVSQLILKQKLLDAYNKKVSSYHSKLIKYFKKLKKCKTILELDNKYLEAQKLAQRAYNYIDSMNDINYELIKPKRDIRSAMSFVKFVYKKQLKYLKENK